MNCSHCNEELREHHAAEGAGKAGAFHCDGCGCCFRDGKQREGVPLCPLASQPEEPEAEFEPELEVENQPVSQSRRRRR